MQVFLQKQSTMYSNHQNIWKIDIKFKLHC